MQIWVLIWQKQWGKVKIGFSSCKTTAAEKLNYKKLKLRIRKVGKEHQGAGLPRQQWSCDTYWVTFHLITAALIRAKQTCCLDHTSHCQTCFCSPLEGTFPLCQGGASTTVSLCQSSCQCLMMYYPSLPKATEDTFLASQASGFKKFLSKKHHLIVLTDFSSVSLFNNFLKSHKTLTVETFHG